MKSTRPSSIKAALLLLVALPLWTFATIIGCTGGDCTEIGCGDEVYVEIKYSEALIPGQYEFAFLSQGESRVCSALLPDATTFNRWCGASMIYRGEPNAELIIAIFDAPSHVTIDVTRDSESIGSAEFDPEYHAFEPNGPDCEPSCRVANATLVLPDGSGEVHVE